VVVVVVAAPDDTGGQNAQCYADGTCADPNAQCIRGVCVCKLGFFFRNAVCGGYILKLLIQAAAGLK